MSRLKIKICGMRDPMNIRQVAELKPDLMGFVFFPASPRYAGEFPVSGYQDSVTPGILKTGVFVDADLYEIKSRIIRFGLRIIQLHGHESPEMCKQLSSTGIRIIKAFPVSESMDFSSCIPYIPYCRWFLFDTVTENSGGSGKKFNWEILDKYKLGHPFFLGGGIGPEDAEAILSIKQPSFAGIDVNSRFETEPGIKDVEKLRIFIRALKNRKTS